MSKRKTWSTEENDIFCEVYRNDIPHAEIRSLLLERGVHCTQGQIKSKAQQNRHLEQYRARMELESHMRTAESHMRTVESYMRTLEMLEELDDRLSSLEHRMNKSIKLG